MHMFCIAGGTANPVDDGLRTFLEVIFMDFLYAGTIGYMVYLQNLGKEVRVRCFLLSVQGDTPAMVKLHYVQFLVIYVSLVVISMNSLSFFFIHRHCFSRCRLRCLA